MVDSPAEGVYNCTKCDQILKTKDEFHEHYGLKHNVIENCLTEMGIDIKTCFDPIERHMFVTPEYAKQSKVSQNLKNGNVNFFFMETYSNNAYLLFILSLLGKTKVKIDILITK